MADFGPFRPLRPYTEAERGLFFGRDREISELVELLAGDRPSALLLGESGVGKTSLLRAGLVPALKSRGIQATYVDAAAIDERVTPASGVLIIDDAGAALVEGPALERLFALLARAGQARSLRVLFSLDENDLFRLELLERRVGAVGPRGSRVRLERFDEALTSDVVERTVLGGGAYFEAGLSREIAVELAARGPVSPSELQLVAAAAVALRLTSLQAWRRAGGADAVGWRLLAATCGRAGGQTAGGQVAHAILAELAAAGPRAVVALDDLARAAGLTDREAEPVAAALVDEALARRAPDGSGYLLASEWLRPIARAFTGELRGRQIAAKLLLRRKIETGGLLKPRQLREVRRVAGTLAPDEEKVLRKSRTVYVGAAIAAAALPLFGLGAAYVSAGRAAHFDGALSPGASIVVRLGRGGGAMSSLPHAPAFGSVLVDSGITRAAMAAPLPTGSFGWSGPSDDAWLRKLVEGMRPLGRAALSLVLDGDVKPLAMAYEDAPLRAAAVAALGAVGRGTPEETALLQKALADGSEDVRRRAVRAAAALERRPGTPPGTGAALLQIALRDAAPGVRGLALEEARALPDERAAPLLAAVVAQSSDPVARRTALDALAVSAARSPQAAAALARAVVGGSGGAANGKGERGGEAAALVGRILDAGGPPSDAAADALAKIALDGKSTEETRVEALRLLRRRAAPPAGLEALGAAGVAPKLAAAAMPLLLKAEEAQAQAQTKIAEAMRGPVALRAAAAAAIALQPKGPDTPKQLKILENDSSAEVRAEAVRAMPVLGREALPLLMKTVRGSGAEMERAAVEAMSTHAQKLGPAAAVQALEGAVKAPRPSTRKAAIEALGHMAADGRAPAVAALARLSRDKVVDVRADAVQALGDAMAGEKVPLPSVKEVGGALRLMARDVDAGVRRRAAASLGRARGAATVPAARALAAFVGDADAGVRAETAAALGALREAAKDAPWAQLLGDKDAGVRAAARRAAREAGAAGGAELDKVLLQTFAGAAAGDRADVAATAGIVAAAATVRAALADSDASVRRAAADGAGGLGAAGATLLVPALGDADPAVRVAAVRGLVGAKAAAPLVEAARGPDLDVRVAALEALGRIGDAGGAAARMALVQAATDASERARAAAARGLGGVGASAGELLEKLLDDPAADVREAAVVGLGAAWSALPPAELRMRLSDEKSADRRAAAALALARQASTQTGAESQKALDEVAKSGTPAVRLTAQLGRAFVGRPDELAAFLHIVRTGG